MTLIAVEAALVVSDPSQRDAIVASSAPIQAATRHDEPGCLVYSFAADAVEPDLIQVYELWEDEESLAAHFAHPNYAAMRDLLHDAGLRSTASRKLRIDATAPVYAPDRSPIAGFPARPRIRAVVFDFGGVLITPLTNQVGTLAGRHDTSLDEMLGVVIGPRDSGGHPWHRAERGELTVAEIQDLLAPWAAEIGLTLHGDEIDVVLAPGSYTIVAPMVERLERLRGEGIRTALLTNTFREFRPTLETIVDLTLFDCIIESYAVSARKPEVAIYEATAAALGVAHREIAYLDDFEQNLAPAKALGWTTIHVSDPLLAIAELDRVLAPA
jgi:epoxide hydrolase-like predicted phosphatase